MCSMCVGYHSDFSGSAKQKSHQVCTTFRFSSLAPNEYINILRLRLLYGHGFYAKLFDLITLQMICIYPVLRLIPVFYQPCFYPSMKSKMSINIPTFFITCIFMADFLYSGNRFPTLKNVY